MSGRVAVHGFTHGPSGYQNYGCRCDRCRQGHAAYMAEARARRAARLAEDPSLAPHGSASTYRNWMCRCRPCIDAQDKRWPKRRAS